LTGVFPGRNLAFLRRSANESWKYLIWIKRLLPFVIIGLAVVGWTKWQDWSEQRDLANDTRMALITAQVQVGTAKHVGEPEAFLTFRDSLLEAEGLSTETMFDYLDRYENHPERYLSYARQVKVFVDSLAAIEKKLIQAAEREAMGL